MLRKFVQSVLILGAGVTGQTMAEFFEKKGVTYQLIADTKNPGAIDWSQYDTVVKSPGVPLHDALIKEAQVRNLQILSDIALFENPHGATVVGVTGTNGKSTVCAIIDHMLETASKTHALGGNFGTPVVALPILPSEGVYVVELSSYQLEVICHPREGRDPFPSFSKMDPGFCEDDTLPLTSTYDIGVLLNIDEDHRDHHLTMEAYIAAKENLLRMAKQKIVVTNDPWTQEMARRHECVTLSNTPNGGYWVKDTTLFKGDTVQADLPIHTGPHDVSNAAVAWIVGKFLNIDAAVMLESLRTFKPLPHRQALVRTIGQVDFINDSKATNIHAVIPSLNRFAGKPIHLILGGVPKFENLDGLVPYIKDVKCVYGIGQASTLIERCLKDMKNFIPCGDMETAVSTIVSQLNFEEPAVVLLAPACASQDQYKNYGQRGDHFAGLVAAI